METNYWIILGLVLLIGEIFTLDFSLSCFGLACLVAAIFSALGLNIFWQLGAVTVTIFILFFTLRPFAMKILFRGGAMKSNVDALIGQIATVAEVLEEDNKKGRVKIDGDIWTVAADTQLAKEDKVKINKIDGITLMVTKEIN